MMVKMRKVFLLIFMSIVTFVSSSQEALTPVNVISPRKFEIPETREDTEIKYIRKENLLSVSGSPIEQHVSLDLGWITVKPNTSYKVEYQFRPENLKSIANIYIMIREHAKKGERPINQNYHREPAVGRQINIDKQGTLVSRVIELTTTSQTNVLSASIIIVALNGEVQFSDVKLFENKSEASEFVYSEKWSKAPMDYNTVVNQLKAKASKHTPQTERPIVFSRTQMKYALGKNYYHAWNDRPLLASTLYREPSGYLTPPRSYSKTLQEVLKYDIDGLAFFPETSNRLPMFDLHDQLSTTIPGVGLLPEFIGTNTADNIKTKTKILERALQSPNAPRVNGKLIITSYWGENLKPSEWKVVLDSLRMKVGDTFIFLPSLTNVANLRTLLLQGKQLTEEDIEKEKSVLRAYLDVCDGIYFNYPPAFTNNDHTFDFKFYRDIFVPVFKSVLAEPPYTSKYFGLSAYRSHMSPERGNHLHEDLTRTLRNSFETAMNARPDIIILPEWDEQNENTSFRPTVYGSYTSQRLLRYYMSKIKNIDPTPVPGDETDIPNLIVSARKVVTLGETITIELLNVPDNTTADEYSAELKLLDENGNLVHQFNKVNFISNELQEHRLKLSSTDLPNVQVLVPVLNIINYKDNDITIDKGFHSIQVRSTWNWDYLAVKQPIRNILRQTIGEINWEEPTIHNDPYILMGKVSSSEELVSVEVVGDEDEAYSVDITDKFGRVDPCKQSYLISIRSINYNPLSGSIVLRNTTGEWLSDFINLNKTNNRADFQTTVSSTENLQWIYLTVVKTDSSFLDFDMNGQKFSINLNDFSDKKIFAKSLGNSLNMTVSQYERQIDYSEPLNRKNVLFGVNISPEINTEVFYLRLISNSGKTFISKPLLVPNKNTANQQLRVYSDSLKRGVDVTINSSKVPNIVYEFDSIRGSVLYTKAGRPFWGSLGSFTATTTGRGAANGFFTGARGQYPSSVSHSNPLWVEEDGKVCLEFDGNGTFMKLPRETLPMRGSFSLNFEIKPLTNKDQFILVNRVIGSQKGLSLQIVNGKLAASFFDKNPSLHNFVTSLSIPDGVWSNVTVSYNFNNITLTVNGSSESFPLSLPANNVGFTIIGEGWTGNWFKGRLRSLSIKHNAE